MMADVVIDPSKRLAEFALGCCNLQRFVFVSSIYANGHLWPESKHPDVVMEERLYPLPLPGQDTPQSAEEIRATIKAVGSSAEAERYDFPWHYAYAKHVAERMVTELFKSHNTSRDLLLIVRPSSLAPAQSFPHRGFCFPLSAPICAYMAALLIETSNPDSVVHPIHQFSPGTVTPAVDHVPVDVVADRLLVHVALGTTGCVHAVNGGASRPSMAETVAGINRRRRLPGKIQIKWKRGSWHSSELHPIVGILTILGTAFILSDEKTRGINSRLLKEGEEEGVELFSSGDFVWPSAGDLQYCAVKMMARKGWSTQMAHWMCGTEPNNQQTDEYRSRL